MALKTSPKPKVLRGCMVSLPSAGGRAPPPLCSTRSSTSGDSLLRFLDPAVGDQPARAFGHPAAQEQHTEAEDAADAEAQAPAEIWRDHVAAEQEQRGSGTDGGPAPNNYR